MLRVMHFPLVCLLAILRVAGAGGVVGPATNPSAEVDLKKFQVAPGLKMEVVASEPLLQNPVAFSISARGQFYIVETHRYRRAIFDITANTPWLLDDLSFRTVPDRAAFLARTFATNLSVLTNDSELIRLVEDRDRDGRAETSSVFATGFNDTVSGTAAGVLTHGTNVWLTSIPDLWRISKDGKTRTKLVDGLGVHISVSGHDVHGLILGPDGRLYFSFGDRGVCVTNLEGAWLNVPDTGGVLRCEPDGRNLEIFCTGLRNPQELAFDDLGNLWTVDNDTAGTDPCRVLHLIEGGDYGWRMSYQHMKGFGPWVQEELWRGGLAGVLPPAGTVSQGPAGLAFYPGTSTTPQLAGKFLHADFPGGITAFSVQPRGASYAVASQEKILWNCWPTDVDFGPDGALYVLDWVQGWNPPGQGRIYRLTSATNALNERVVAEVKRLLGEGMARRGEKELLALLGHQDRRVRLEAQWELAGRQAVRALSSAAEVGKNQMARLHAIWGLGQITRSTLPPRYTDEMWSLSSLLWDDDVQVRSAAARLFGEARLLNVADTLRARLVKATAGELMAILQAEQKLQVGFSRNAGFRDYRSMLRHWQDALASARHQPRGGFRMVSPIHELFQALDQARDPFITSAGIQLLDEMLIFSEQRLHASVGNTYTNFVLNVTNRAPVSRVALLRALARHAHPTVTHFLSDTDAWVTLEAARAINDAPVPAAYPALASLLEDARFREPNWGWSALSNLTPAGPFSATVRPPREQVLRRALNANFRLGERTNAEALVKFARGTEVGAPDALRAEALFLLGAWEVRPATVGDLPIKPTKDPNHGAVPTVNPENWPGWFDRVVGLWRPLPPRPAEPAQAALAPQIAALIADAAEPVATAALEATGPLRLTNAAPALLARLQDPRSPAALRARVPGALARLDAPELARALEIALAETDPVVRASALPHLGKLNGARATEILGSIVSTTGQRTEGELRLAQAALTALGKLPTPEASVLLQSALTNLAAGQWPAALELELIEAAALRPEPATKILLAQRAARQPANDLAAAWRFTLEGGAAERGRAVFFEKVEVQCSRCHQVKKDGGVVGPALDGVGRRLTRAQLLESILLPNKTIAVGFENVTVTLRDGRTLAGLLKSETATELVLDSPEDGKLQLLKTDLTARQRGLSAMPEDMGRVLSAREVRDLVQFLSGLR